MVMVIGRGEPERPARATAPRRLPAAAELLPDWLPIYPGVAVEVRQGLAEEALRAGTLILQGSFGAGELVDFYAAALETAGLEIGARRVAATGRAGYLAAADAAGGRRFRLAVSSGEAVLTFEERAVRPE